MDDEMHALARELGIAHPPPASARGYRDNVDLLDAELARAFLEIQLAENASAHGVRRNPALWTGEAVFSVIIADDTRLRAPRASGCSVRPRGSTPSAAFLAAAPATIGDVEIPGTWIGKAIRECAGAAVLLDRGIPLWLASGAIAERRRSCADGGGDSRKGGVRVVCRLARHAAHGDRHHAGMRCGAVRCASLARASVLAFARRSARRGAGTVRRGTGATRRDVARDRRIVGQRTGAARRTIIRPPTTTLARSGVRGRPAASARRFTMS